MDAWRCAQTEKIFADYFRPEGGGQAIRDIMRSSDAAVPDRLLDSSWWFAASHHMTGPRFSPPSPRHCERSEAIQEPRSKDWIASSQELLAMTGLRFSPASPRHCERSEAIPEPRSEDWIASSQELLAMTGLRFPPASPRHCERSEAIQEPGRKSWIVSRSLSSGAHSRDPLARNDEYCC